MPAGQAVHGDGEVLCQPQKAFWKDQARFTRPALIEGEVSLIEAGNCLGREAAINLRTTGIICHDATGEIYLGGAALACQ